MAISRQQEAVHYSLLYPKYIKVDPIEFKYHIVNIVVVAFVLSSPKFLGQESQVKWIWTDTHTQI